jgi:hypothetical protein
VAGRCACGVSCRYAADVLPGGDAPQTRVRALAARCGGHPGERGDHRLCSMRGEDGADLSKQRTHAYAPAPSTRKASVSAAAAPPPAQCPAGLGLPHLVGEMGGQGPGLGRCQDHGDERGLALVDPVPGQTMIGAPGAGPPSSRLCFSRLLPRSHRCQHWPARHGRRPPPRQPGRRRDLRARVDGRARRRPE